MEEGWTLWSWGHICKEKRKVVGVVNPLHITLESVSRRGTDLQKRKEPPYSDPFLLFPPKACLCSWATYSSQSGHGWPVWLTLLSFSMSLSAACAPSHTALCSYPGTIPRPWSLRLVPYKILSSWVAAAALP
uniref:Uncharacterized protein n=1 Tax=Knipowitschia caucasica TaxID=637954 RepID=A0AAV2L5E8_KNICA